MTTTTYDGSDIGDAKIESDTNPWVELDGEPVDWMRVLLPRRACPCGESGKVLIPGVLDAMDTPEGIQRCDTCNTYPGDLDAALALAKLVGGVVKFTQEDT